MLEFMSVKLWHKLDQWLDETSRPLPAGQKSIQPQDGRQQLYCLQVCQFHVMLCYVMLCYAHKIYLQDCKQWRLHFPLYSSLVIHFTCDIFCGLLPHYILISN